MADFLKMLGQFQEMQSRLAEAQERLESMTFTASAGGGAVSVDCDGKMIVKGVRIERAAVNPDDVEMLEQLVLAAVSEAQRKAARGAQDELGKVTGGIDLPFKLPFS